MTKDPRNAVLELLLADIRDAFAKEGGVEISSADLVKALVAIEGRPWAERGKNGKRGKPLTQFKLAHMLKPLAIASGHIGSEARVRGYKLWQFEEAFSRYLPPEGLSSRRVQEQPSGTRTRHTGTTAKTPSKPASSTPSLGQSCARKCLPGVSRLSSNAS